MNLSLILLLNNILKSKLILFCLKKNYFSYDISLFLTKSLQKIIIISLRLSSLLNNSIFLELNVVERVDSFDSKKFSIFYYFFLPFMGTKLCINFLCNQELNIESLSNYFQGLEWAEREMYDMFGISFLNKKDARHLLLDFSFIGFPLLKSFCVVGYFELYYDYIEQSLCYIPLQLSESEKWRFGFFN